MTSALPTANFPAFGAPKGLTAVADEDQSVIAAQLGRPARGILAIAYRCAHQIPAVVMTAPRLADGTPFPTLYYQCCQQLNAAVSRMEAAGVMREMTDRLAVDPDLAELYRRAHLSYLATRNALADLGNAVSAGGMPDRVKCLHVLIAHALAVGSGVNPLGDEAVAQLGNHFKPGLQCVPLAQD